MTTPVLECLLGAAGQNKKKVATMENKIAMTLIAMPNMRGILNLALGSSSPASFRHSIQEMDTT